jgi:hypothetical protein
MGIGTLQERTLHAMLKRYLEPDESRHEVQIGAYVADIARDNEIIEIQTRAFEKLKPKLKAYLPNHTVTVVYPIAHEKWITWVDPKDGTLSPRRKSPKQGSEHDVFFELFKIKAFLTHPNFRLKLIFLDVDEYRSQNGWSRDGKRGSERIERIPLSIVRTVTASARDGYAILLPLFDEDTFTAKDYQKKRHCTPRSAWRALTTLREAGAIFKIGKQGNAFVYQIAKEK